MFFQKKRPTFVGRVSKWAGHESVPSAPPWSASGVGEMPELGAAEVAQNGVEKGQSFVAGESALRTRNLGARVLGELSDGVHLELAAHPRHVAPGEVVQVAVLERLENLANRRVVAHGDDLLLGQTFRLRTA